MTSESRMAKIWNRCPKGTRRERWLRTAKRREFVLAAGSAGWPARRDGPIAPAEARALARLGVRIPRSLRPSVEGV